MKRRIKSSAALLLLILCQIRTARPQTAKPTEYEVKAAYLSNFGRFVEWPGSEQQATPGPFNVCVIGVDPFGGALEKALKDETIGGASVLPRRLDKVQDAAGCRILFISTSEDSRLKGILAGLNNAGILTVGESPDFSRRGGMIQFVLEGNKVRFEVNLAAVQRARLSLSSELTKLAVAVRRAP